MIKLASSEEPPWLIKGRVTPVSGIRRVTPPTIKKAGFSAGSRGEATHGKEHKQDEHGAAAQKAHLLADSRKDKVGLDDGDVVGHAVADANTDQAAIGKREERLDDLVALALGVLKRIDPNLETHLNVRQELVGAHSSNG